MEYWAGGFLQDLLIITSLIAVAAGIRRAWPAMQRLAMPDALIAGLLGVLLGPAVLDLLPFSAENLEFVIYHSLALVFITVSLQSPPPGKPSGSARSIAFAIPFVAVLQGMIGLVCVLGWNSIAGGPNLHTGFAMLLPLSFNQGPGQAMTFGSAWEREAGMADGAQIGLIMAAIGLAWCCVIGVGLVAWGRLRGWDRTKGRSELASADAEPEAPRVAPKQAAFGKLEPLTAQIVAVALVYLATWMFLDTVVPLLPEQHQPTLWSFHFLIATGFALLLRPLAIRVPQGNPLDDDLLARMSSVIVDVATCAALAAVSVSVLGANLWPVLLYLDGGRGRDPAGLCMDGAASVPNSTVRARHHHLRHAHRHRHHRPRAASHVGSPARRTRGAQLCARGDTLRRTRAAAALAHSGTGQQLS